jgi:hypothetical protein
MPKESMNQICWDFLMKQNLWWPPCECPDWNVEQTCNTQWPKQTEYLLFGQCIIWYPFQGPFKLHKLHAQVFPLLFRKNVIVIKWFAADKEAVLHWVRDFQRAMAKSSERRWLLDWSISTTYREKPLAFCCQVALALALWVQAVYKKYTDHIYTSCIPSLDRYLSAASQPEVIGSTKHLWF